MIKQTAALVIAIGRGAHVDMQLTCDPKHQTILSLGAVLVGVRFSGGSLFQRRADDVCKAF